MAPSRDPGLGLLRVIIVAVALVFGLRLFVLQILQHDHYLSLANRQWQKELPLAAPRGNLYDRGGTPLAVGVLQYRVSADPQAYRERSAEGRKKLLATLSGALRLSERELRRALGARGRYALLHEGLTLDVEATEALRATGVVHLEQRSRRLYPMGPLAGPLLGFVNAEDQGVCGLEAGLQAELAGTPGVELVQKDDRGRVLISPLNRRLVEPKRGRDVYLTLDHKIQAIVDLELARAAEESGAHGAAAVVLDPHSGEILALSSWPAVAARDADRYDPAQWKLLPVQGLYEPGSTLKAVTSIALLERGDVSLATQIDAENGSAEIDGFTVRDDTPHPGYLSFREAFAFSSNICFAKLSQRLSREQLFGTLQDLGFGNSTGVLLPGELEGVLRKPAEWSRRSKLTLVFGQELSATPLQVTSAVGALATGGLLMRPRILRGSADPDGRHLREDEPVLLRRVCRPETARTILQLMGDVVEMGTGTAAAVPGLRVGGKTGTAQKFEGGRLKPGKYLASFVGVAPLDAPRIVIGIFIDEPGWGYCHGGQSAAPAFAHIVEKLAVATPELLAPSAGEAPDPGRFAGRPVPRFLELDLAAAEELAGERGLQLRLRGHGRRVVAQQPDPGCVQRPDSPLTLVLGDPEKPSPLPKLVGLSLREARRLALERGYQVAPRGWGVVVEQGAPDPGRGGAIPLRLAQPGGGRSS